jgi:hypothetical protein
LDKNGTQVPFFVLEENAKYFTSSSAKRIPTLNFLLWSLKIKALRVKNIEHTNPQSGGELYSIKE